MTAFFNVLFSLISDYFPLILLILCGIYLSFSGHFFQITRLNDSIKLFYKAFKTKKKDAFSSFSAACTSLSAAVGTGNIAGVAGALSIGGAGAIFWMWISALLGMAVKSAEITLAVKYRQNNNGEYSGGTVYCIKNGLSSTFHPLARLFCLAGLPAVLCTGNITQTNAAVSSFSNTTGIKILSGIILAVLTFAVTRGGLKGIGNFTEKIVPVMSLLYILLCSTVIIFNIDFLPEAFKMIIKGAFNPKAVTGGAVGSAMTAILIGTQRGIFSNEAGLGTAGIVHAAASDAKTEAQGLFGIFEVFADTVILCTLTAITILCSRVKVGYSLSEFSPLVISALSTLYGKFAAPIISVMLCLFAFSSIIGFAAYGKSFAEYLFGEKISKIWFYFYPLGCIIGAVAKVKFAWDIAAFFNGIMLLINLPVIILLSDNAIMFLKKRKKDVKIKS